MEDQTRLQNGGAKIGHYRGSGTSDKIQNMVQEEEEEDKVTTRFDHRTALFRKHRALECEEFFAKCRVLSIVTSCRSVSVLWKHQSQRYCRVRALCLLYVT